jgi:hypothetical protein
MTDNKADHYRTRALEAERRAAEAIDPELRRTWLAVAQHWREMADQADRQDL